MQSKDQQDGIDWQSETNSLTFLLESTLTDSYSEMYSYILIMYKSNGNPEYYSQALETESEFSLHLIKIKTIYRTLIIK